MTAGNLDRIIQFRRASLVDNGFGMVEEFANHGGDIWAKKTEVSDSERFRASAVSASITARFVVRWSDFTRDITPKDRLVCEGREFDISGLKEVDGRRRFLEITAAARVDLA